MANNLVREDNGRATSRRESEQFITPPASVSETADGYTLELEMPGVNKDGLEISVENNELSIIGRRSAPTIDILERLADLIRPALAWREGSQAEKPAGAFDGRGFVVTQAMTSLTGSAGEDFASILRALGYRMDKRPPLPPPLPARYAPRRPI